MLRLGVPVWVVSLCFFLCADISTQLKFHSTGCVSPCRQAESFGIAPTKLSKDYLIQQLFPCRFET